MAASSCLMEVSTEKLAAMAAPTRTPQQRRRVIPLSVSVRVWPSSDRLKW